MCNCWRDASTLWGIAAAVFCILASAVLFSTKILALLGVLMLAAGLILASLGLAAIAVWLGGKVSEVAGSLESDTLSCLKGGLAVLLLASLLPYIGWLLVLFALASGIGATLETLTARKW